MAWPLHRYVSWLFPIFNALFLKEAVGVSNVPLKGPFILASNHISIPDEWVMVQVIYKHTKQPIWFIARDDYWWAPWWTKFLKNAFATLLIDWKNPSQVLEQAKDSISKNNIIGIYPEGTRNLDPKVLAIGKTGTARLALATGVPVIPVGYFGPPIATVWDVVRNFVLKRNTVSLHFGQAIDLSEFKDKPVDRKLLHNATDKIMVEIGKLSNKKPRLH
jgi:1-acyl-sn-glycerol-3-phosphate acyltransferase